MTFHPRLARGRTLPLIDVSGLYSDDSETLRGIADQLGRAAREIGFFRITGHGIDPALIEEAYQAAAAFFAQRETMKMRHYIGANRNHRGYVPFSEKGDYADEVNRNYEAFDLGPDLPWDDPEVVAGLARGAITLGPNPWPALPGFHATIARYFASVARLGLLVTGALERHLRLPPGTLTRHMTKPVSQLRLLHYVRATGHGAGPGAQKTVNMGAHTDYECLTLLHTRNPGLQVMTAADTWIDVPVDPAVYVVNIGDMLEAWSNGILRSTPHRVLNLSPERFSMPYFVAANHGTLIRPLPALVPEGEAPRYEPFTAGAHLERMLVRDFPYLRRRRNTPAGPVHNPFETRIEREIRP